jgi:hypothetical protein
MSDGRFKTQFETNTSKGQLNNTTRRDAEKKMFGYADDLDPKKRPIYAYLSPDGSQDGTTAYGSVIVKLKNDVKSRTTLFGSDTLMATNNAKEPTAKISTFDDFNVESVPLKLGADIGHTHVDTILKDSEDIRKMSTRPYIEAQVHEGVTVKDIDSIIFKKRPDKIVTDQLDAAGIKWEVKKTWK